jgi:hypothetical protein
MLWAFLFLPGKKNILVLLRKNSAFCPANNNYLKPSWFFVMSLQTEIDNCFE